MLKLLDFHLIPSLLFLAMNLDGDDDRGRETCENQASKY